MPRAADHGNADHLRTAVGARDTQNERKRPEALTHRVRTAAAVWPTSSSVCTHHQRRTRCTAVLTPAECGIRACAASFNAASRELRARSRAHIGRLHMTHVVVVCMDVWAWRVRCVRAWPGGRAERRSTPSKEVLDW